MIWTLITLTHVVTIFCFLWFFISHIWFVRLFRGQYSDPFHGYYNYGYDYNHDYYVRVYKKHFSEKTALVLIITILVVYYVIGIVIIVGRLWDRYRVSGKSKETIKDHINTEQVINDEKTGDINALYIHYF